MKSILILCRGKSLENYNLLNKKFDCVAIVNDFRREVSQDANLVNFLRSNRLIHYVCREYFSLPTVEMVNVLGIEYCQLNALQGELDSGTNNVSRVLDHHKIPYKPMGEKIIPYSLDGIRQTDVRPFPHLSIPTTGIVAVLDAASNKGFTDITVLGIDFYESEYLTVCSSTNTKEAPKKSGIDKAPYMKSFLTDQLKKLPDVNFEFYTYSSFDPGLPNVKIINERLENE
jgi:hypothetical protein